MGSRFLRPSVVVLAGALIAAAPGAGADKGAVVSDAPLQRKAGLLGQPYVPGEIIVKFRAGASTAARSSALRSHGVRVLRKVGSSDLAVVSVPEDMAVREAAEELAEEPSVAFAEPNYVRQLSATIPNDPRFGDLWGLNHNPTPTNDDINAPEAWDLNTGSGDVVVAVIDSGAALSHPDLASNLVAGFDFVQNDNQPLDFNGHGTHVAGTIGAQGNNGVGITGVNWDVSIMPLRAADAYGSLADDDIIAAIQYACDHGADVVNGSFGGPDFSQATADAITHPDCADTLFVFAAGTRATTSN